MNAFFRALAAVLTLMLLAACGGSEQYFRLGASGPVPLTGSGQVIGVGPVTLPGYIDRAELVFQSGDYQFLVPPKVRWAGTLKENFSRTLAADVAIRLGTGSVLAYPWPPGTRLRRQVAVDVQKFHAVSGGVAILEATWLLQEPGSRRVLRRQNGRFTERIVGDGYGPVVAAESRLVAQLADAVAASLR